jgi:alpha-glucosidase
MEKSSSESWIWWKHGVIYHIYPRSFCDSDGDGIGDLRGITSKLNYLQHLGVDAIWLSPVYKSPMIDFGYDVSDYCSIDPVFGTMDHLKELLVEAHKKGIRIIMDMILNHTSNLHPWFIESGSSADNPKRNWFIWRSGTNGKKPNNWKSVYGGSAWEYDSRTNMYYLHTFFKEQPDLNWRNREVKQTFNRIFKFWLDFGIDGFRLDAINMIVKDKKFRNNPALLTGLISRKKWHTRNQRKSYKIVQNLRKLMDSYDDRMCVGEIYTLPPGDARLSGSYLGSGDNSIHLTFDFSLFFRRWGARNYFKTIEQWYSSIPDKGWPSNVLSNHDLRRGINRFGPGNIKFKRAKVAAALLLTLKGTPFIYYGEELGMQNGKITLKNIRDPLGKKFWPLYSGRDKARTPMQWSDMLHAGFTQGKPWLPLNMDYKSVNVQNELGEQHSLLNFYIALIKLRKEYPSLYAGNWEPKVKGRKNLIAYYRISGNQKIFIALNFSSAKRKHLYFRKPLTAKVLLSTHQPHQKIITFSHLILSPSEATILEIK